MAKIKFTEDSGRCVLQYPGQCSPQPQYMEIHSDGTVYFYVSSSIGWTCSQDVFNGKIHRVNLGHAYDMTHKMRREIFRKYKPLIERVVAGMDEKWNGNNYVGTLTDDASDALEELSYRTSNEEV